jgi:uncharacterized protein
MKNFDEYQKMIIPVLKKHMITRSAVFGSFAKGTNNCDSDIDLLIEPSTGFTLVSYFDLQWELEELTNRKIDLVEYRAIKNSIREEVLATAIELF